MIPDEILLILFTPGFVLIQDTNPRVKAVLYAHSVKQFNKYVKSIFVLSIEQRKRKDLEKNKIEKTKAIAILFFA